VLLGEEDAPDLMMPSTVVRLRRAGRVPACVPDPFALNVDLPAMDWAVALRAEAVRHARSPGAR
jgi:hypothetical protein